MSSPIRSVLLSSPSEGSLSGGRPSSFPFPGPGAPVQIVLKKRDARNVFQEIWKLSVDPKDPFVDDAKPASPGPLMTLEQHGAPAEKVDFLILGDGYTAAERGKFEKDARR